MKAMMTIDVLQRVFTYKDKGKEILLDDPDEAMSPEDVLNFYTGTYAELVTAKLKGR
jgi:PRTRC genetic system protein C